jgi:hypothetical protein
VLAGQVIDMRAYVEVSEIDPNTTIRLANIEIPGMLLRKGDARAGAVLVKVLNRGEGTSRLYAEATRGDGERVWMRPALSDQEVELDRYIERAIKVDPDIWVVEI